MEWIESQSSFKYNHKPVTRKKFVFKTIFGDFEVFESVNGKSWYRHPFLRSEYISWTPFGYFDNGLEEWFGKTKAPCYNLEEGIKICETVMSKIKERVSEYTEPPKQ